MLHKAVFIDRDGVILELPPATKDGTLLLESGDPQAYTMHEKDVHFLPGVYKAIKSLGAKYQIVIVSNQSCVGRGFVQYHKMYEVFCHVERKIHAHAKVKCRWRFCHHAPGEGCACRKPAPGMLWFYMVNYQYDRRKCWMVGDSMSDIEAGYRAEIPPSRLIYIDPENSPIVPAGIYAENHICSNLAEAAEIILGSE